MGVAEGTTSNECKVLLASIEGVRKEAQTMYAHLGETMRMGLEGVHKNIEASSIVTNMHLKELADHAAKTNGHVADLYKKYEERGKVVEEFKEYKTRFDRHAKGIKWVKRHWGKVLIGFCVAVLLLFVVYELVGVHKISEMIFNKMVK